MSKLLVSLPGGMVKNGVVGALVALVSYVLLQCLSAFLICEEIVACEMVFPAVCVSAAIASFVGCFYSAVRTGKGMALSAVAVVAVFLSLTVMVAVCMNAGGVDGAGLVGVGIAMSIGGLVAAVLCGVLGNRGGGRRERGRNRHTRR